MVETLHIWLLRLAILGLAASFLWPGGILSQLSRGLSPRTRRLVLGLVALAAALRVLGAVWSVVHQNAHGFATVEWATTLPGLGPRGSAGLVLYHLALQLGLDAPQTIFVVNLVLSSVAPALAFLAARAWFRSDAAGVLAGILLATSSVHIRLSASETLFVPELAFALCAVAALTALLRHSDSSPLPFAFATVLAVQSRVLGLLHLAPLALVLLVSWRRLSVRPDRRWISALVVLAAGLGLQIVWLLVQISADGTPGYAPNLEGLFRGFVSPLANPILDPGTSPAVLLVALAVALAGLFRRGRVLLLPLLGGVLVTGLAHSGFSFNIEDRLRHHLPVLVWLVLLAGGAGPLLDRLRERVGPRALIVWPLLLGGAALGLVQNAGMREARHDTQQEYALLASSLPTLPPKATVVLAPERFPGSGVGTTVPRTWLRRAGDVFGFLDAEDWLDGAPRPPNALWYQGVSCWTYDSAELAGLRAATPGADIGLRPICRRMRAQPGVQPLYVRRVPARPEGPVTGVDELTIGWYRLPAEPRAPQERDGDGGFRFVR